MPDAVHLTKAYRARPSLRTPREKRAISACERAGEQVSIFDDPSNEALITCPSCLAWLATGDNRLIVTPGGIEEWIASRVAARDPNLHYIDIPVDEP